MKLQFLIISAILVGLFCAHSNAADTNRQSFFLMSALGNKQLPAQNSIEMKSPTKAAAFSIVVPGTGELYSGAKRGYIHIAAEVGLFAAYVFIHRDAEEKKDNFEELIRKHVKFTDGKSYFDKWKWEDYEHATMFNHWNNPYYKEISKDQVGPFYWEGYKSASKDEVTAYCKSRQEALDIRNDSNNRFQLARGFLGGVILNHFFSAIDARILAKEYNKQADRTFPVTFKMDFSPEFVSGKILFEKKF